MFLVWLMVSLQIVGNKQVLLTVRMIPTLRDMILVMLTLYLVVLVRFVTMESVPGMMAKCCSDWAPLSLEKDLGFRERTKQTQMQKNNISFSSEKKTNCLATDCILKPSNIETGCQNCCQTTLCSSLLSNSRNLYSPTPCPPPPPRQTPHPSQRH